MHPDSRQFMGFNQMMKGILDVKEEREKKEGYDNIKQNSQTIINKGGTYLKTPRTRCTHHGKHHQHHEVLQRKGNSTGRNRYTKGSTRMGRTVKWHASRSLGANMD